MGEVKTLHYPGIMIGTSLAKKVVFYGQNAAETLAAALDYLSQAMPPTGEMAVRFTWTGTETYPSIEVNIVIDPDVTKSVPGIKHGGQG